MLRHFLAIFYTCAYVNFHLFLTSRAILLSRRFSMTISSTIKSDTATFEGVINTSLREPGNRSIISVFYVISLVKTSV